MTVARFVYLGPLDEPGLDGAWAFGRYWERGVAQAVDDQGIVARLGRHPHFRIEDDEDEGVVAEAAPSIAVKRRGRPPGSKNGSA